MTKSNVTQVYAPFATEFSFMEVKVVTRDGKLKNDSYFVGRLPVEGETVEMVFVGQRPDGTMRFQLRVKS